MGTKYTCVKCGAEFESKKGCKSRTPKYCSSKCYADSMRLEVTCLICGKIIKNKHSVSIKNRKYCSRECHAKSRAGVELSEEWKKSLSEGRKKSEKCKGENLYNWKGGSENTKFLAKERYYRTKHDIIGKLPREKLAKILEFQENKCFFCECDLTNYKAIEHLTPVTRNGDNSFYNLVYSCKSCNSKKRQQTFEEFAIKNKRADWLLKWENLLIEIC